MNFNFEFSCTQFQGRYTIAVGKIAREFDRVCGQEQDDNH